MKRIERESENEMYKVISNEVELERFISLNEAMLFAKAVGIFVTIRGPEFEVVGHFGVDTVANGVCPDGVEYDWNKASRIGRVKKERV
jgi:hypothetical protein